jgi:hypothetical protein
MLGLHQDLTKDPYHIPKLCTDNNIDIIPRPRAQCIAKYFSPTSTGTRTINTNDNYIKMPNICDSLPAKSYLLT